MVNEEKCVKSRKGKVKIQLGVGIEEKWHGIRECDGRLDFDPE